MFHWCNGVSANTTSAAASALIKLRDTISTQQRKSGLGELVHNMWLYWDLHRLATKSREIMALRDAPPLDSAASATPWPAPAQWCQSLRVRLEIGRVQSELAKRRKKTTTEETAALKSSRKRRRS